MMRDLFRDKDFLRLFFANMLSSCGQGMTAIGIPWALTKQFGGATESGSLMALSAVVAFCLSLYFGVLIDRHKRKTLLQVENITGFTLQCGLAIAAFYFTSSAIPLYVSYLITIVIFHWHYPVLYALSQESFSREHYAHISGLLEIIGQTASIVAGLLAGALLEYTAHGIAIVLLLDGLTYLFSFVILLPYTYNATVGVNPPDAVSHISENFSEKFFKVSRDLRSAILYLRTQPRLFTFGMSLYTPFLILLVVDLINPVFVQKTLLETASVFTIMEAVYAFGALCAGLFVRRVASMMGDKLTYISAFALFVFGLLLNASLISFWSGLVMMLFVGWGNAGCRVSRLAVFMQIVPPEFQGRVSTLINTTALPLRTGLILGFTYLLGFITPAAAYSLCAVIIVTAFAGFWYSHRAYIDLHLRESLVES
jgi:MFS family permease